MGQGTGEKSAGNSNFGRFTLIKEAVLASFLAEFLGQFLRSSDCTFPRVPRKKVHGVYR